MTLDAAVYCDCFAKGLIKESPSTLWQLTYAPDGSLTCDSEDLETLLAFDAWWLDRACEHKGGVVVHHYLGNIALINCLREELKTDVKRYPLLLERVLYSGTHAGDYIPVELLESLSEEVKRLVLHECREKKNAAYVHHFQEQMMELLQAAMRLQKPISF